MSAEEVDEYLNAVKEPKRGTLEALRRTILEIVTKAEQLISYRARLPGFSAAGSSSLHTREVAGSSPAVAIKICSATFFVVVRTTLRYMSQPLSLRLPEATLDRLGTRARSRSMAPRTLAQRYVEEGLRTDENPLIRFVDGPAGRRPRLQGTGLDVWEAISVVHDNDGNERASAGYLQIPLGLAQAAVAYYGAYRDEIDEWIELNRREGEAAQAAWLAGRQALQR